VDCRTLRGHSGSGGRAIAWPVLCGMIDACRVGGLELIASGVATADDLRAARAMGFTLAEGDHLGAPMAFDMAMAELTAAPALVPVRAALL